MTTTKTKTLHPRKYGFQKVGTKESDHSIEFWQHPGGLVINTQFLNGEYFVTRAKSGRYVENYEIPERLKGWVIKQIARNNGVKRK